MDVDRRHNADTLCRTCLKVLSEDVLDTSKRDIFLTPDMVKKLVLCTSLIVEPQDGYPKHLCDCCHAKLNEFHQFQKMCVESAQRFGEVLQLSAGDTADNLHYDGDQSYAGIIIPKIEITTEDTELKYPDQMQFELSRKVRFPEKLAGSAGIKQSDATEQSEASGKIYDYIEKKDNNLKHVKTGKTPAERKRKERVKLRLTGDIEEYKRKDSERHKLRRLLLKSSNDVEVREKLRQKERERKRKQRQNVKEQKVLEDIITSQEKSQL